MAKMGHNCIVCGEDYEHLPKECIQKQIDKAVSAAIIAERKRVIEVFSWLRYDIVAEQLETRGLP